MARETDNYPWIPNTHRWNEDWTGSTEFSRRRIRHGTCAIVHRGGAPSKRDRDRQIDRERGREEGEEDGSMASIAIYGILATWNEEETAERYAETRLRRRTDGSTTSHHPQLASDWFHHSRIMCRCAIPR